MRTRFVVTLVALVACTPSLDEPPPATSTPAPHASASAAPAATLVDVRVEFETGLDPDYGQGAESVRAFLVVPVLSIHRKLFAVPYPFHCLRRETDASSALGVECRGDDGNGWAEIETTPDRIIVIARDYGRLDLMKTRVELPLPAGAIATLFAPAKYP